MMTVDLRHLCHDHLYFVHHFVFNQCLVMYSYDKEAAVYVSSFSYSSEAACCKHSSIHF